MTKLLPVLLLISLTLIYCKTTPSLKPINGEKVNRHNYNTIMSYVNGYIPFNRDNYLNNEIKSITVKAYTNKRASLDSVVEMTLNDHFVYYYDENRRLAKYDKFNESGEYTGSRYNFGKGFNLFDNSNYQLTIDSSKLLVRYIINDNEEFEYNLNSNFRIKEVKRIIKDSSKITTFYNYENELLKTFVNRQKTELYDYDSQKRITQYRRITNHEKYKINLDSIPESTIKYSYREDTVRISNLSKSGEVENSKLFYLSESTAIPVKSSSQKYSRSHKYIDDLSLIETKYVMYRNSTSTARDSSIIIYKYEIDNYGNWTKRIDNGIENYTREYIYDDFENWIKMIEFEKGLKVKEIHRKYEYAEE